MDQQYKHCIFRGPEIGRELLEGVVTSDNSAKEQEGTEEKVSCSSSKAINDLSLANGENYSKNLAHNQKSYKEKIRKSFSNMPLLIQPFISHTPLITNAHLLISYAP